MPGRDHLLGRRLGPLWSLILGKWGLLQPFMPLGGGHTCLYALTTLVLGDRNTLALASVTGTHSGLSYQRPRTFLVRPLLSKDLSQRPPVKVREVCHSLVAVFDNGPVWRRVYPSGFAMNGRVRPTLSHAFLVEALGSTVLRPRELSLYALCLVDVIVQILALMERGEVTFRSARGAALSTSPHFISFAAPHLTMHR